MKNEAIKTLDEIKHILQAHASDLRSQYGIVSLSVFCSVVRGEAREDSDVDIIASFSRPVGLLKLISAEYFISDLLGTKVDLIPSYEVRPELMERIYSEAVPMWNGTLPFTLRIFPANSRRPFRA